MPKCSLNTPDFIILVPLSVWVSLVIGFPVSFIFLSNYQLLILLISCFILFISILIISALIFISFHLMIFTLHYSYFSKILALSIKFLYLSFSVTF